MSVHHTRTGTTTRISVDSAGNKGNGDSYLPYISDDGRFVVFRSAADKLSEEDTNSMMDLFNRAVPRPTGTAVVPNHLPIGESTPITISGSYFFDDSVLSSWPVLFRNVVIVDENTLTAEAFVPPFAAAGTRDSVIALPGTGPAINRRSTAICADCVTLQ